MIASSWDETLVGGLGDDTYRFSGSFGLDTIRDRTFTLGGSGNDSIAISGVSAASVRVSRSSQNDDLVVSVVNSLGTEISSVTIDGQFSGNVNDVIESLKIGSAAAINLTGGLTMQGVRDQTTLFGTSLADRFISNAWNETFYGNLGNDTYAFSAGFGTDTIQDRTLTLGGGGYDTVDMSTLSRSSIRMNVDGSDLVLSLVNSLGSRTASVSISSQYGGNLNDVIELLKFSGGSMALTGGLTVQGVRDEARVTGTTFADTVISGRWNETLAGGGGNDIYRFSSGFGQDVIVEGRSNGGSDRIVFDSSINVADVRLQRVSAISDDLVIRVVDANERVLSSVTIDRYFDGGDYLVEFIQFGTGPLWSIASLLRSVAAAQDRTRSPAGPAIRSSAGMAAMMSLPICGQQHTLRQRGQ